MAEKKTKKTQKPYMWIVRNLVAAAVVIVILIFAAQAGLGLITRHGKTVKVPDFTNMTVAEAVKAAAAADVRVKVTDSVFSRRLPAGIVYRQRPKSGATVKKGRSIFLTINSIVPRKVVMPNLVGYSYIEARAELTNRGLSLGKLTYVRDIATNNVLSQSVHGRNINPGDLVVSGSDVDLTLGLSSDEGTAAVPRVTGMKYIRAIDAIHDRCMNVGRVRFDEGILTYADSTDAVVYKQDAAGVQKPLGTPVDIWLTLDASKVTPPESETEPETKE